MNKTAINMAWLKSSASLQCSVNIHGNRYLPEQASNQGYLHLPERWHPDDQACFQFSEAQGDC